MHDTHAVRLVQRIGDLEGIAQRYLDRERAFLQAGGQRFASFGGNELCCGFTGRTAKDFCLRSEGALNSGDNQRIL
jgi:hypothetical protein